MIYSKAATTIAYQITQLKARGMIFKDEKYAEMVLSHISYYRLVGYWWPMQQDPKTDHIFKPNSRFEAVVDLYNFDSELRTLLFDVIEQIEIAFRSKMMYQLSHEYDPWWFENPANFHDSAHHAQSLKTIKSDLGRTKEIFISEHYTKYNSDTRNPPCWKTLEVISLGTLSKLYGNLCKTCISKDVIAAEFGVANHTYLHSWIQDIAQIRNICAHHGRVWNKNLPGRPKMLSRPPNLWIHKTPPVSDHHMLYIHLCTMKYLFNVIHPGNNFSYRLFVLLKKYPNVDLKALGMERNWYKEPLWDNKLHFGRFVMPFVYKGIYVFNNFRFRRKKA
jgi:abortive infection bacteriophage resistance protein